MKFVGDKINHYCKTCRTRRRIGRCRVCWGDGKVCVVCNRTGYVCEKANGDRLHLWKNPWA
jgi:hypothetical protein